MLGCLDGAQETLQPVLTTPPERRVRPLLLLLDKVRRMGSGPALATERIVGTIREAIVDFQRHWAIKELN